MVIPSVELQKAVYRELATGKYPVYDTAPTNHELPYILIGNVTRVPNDTKTNSGYTMSMMFHAYSENNSSLEVKEMSYFIEKTLTREFEITGFNNERQFLSLATQQEEEYKDSLVHHHILEITFIISKQNHLEKGE